MKLKLNERIRALRRKSGRTQEELAGILGVSPQAVSRWESAAGYPDTETLPRLANCFGVSLDELFGYEGDRDRRVDALIERVDRMAWANEYDDVNLDECASLLREGLAEYPGDERLTMALAEVLSRMGWMRHSEWMHYGEDGYIRYDFDRHRKNPYWKEAEKLCGDLLSRAEDLEIRTKAARELIRMERVLGKKTRAAEIADTLPPLAFSREILRTEATHGKEQAGPLGEALLELAYQFAELLMYALVNNIHHYDTPMPVEKVKGAIALFDLLGDDGRLGIYHRERAYLNLYLSRLLWEYGERDAAFGALDEALRDARAYDAFAALAEKGEYRYSAPLLSRAVPKTDRFPESGPLAGNLPACWPMWCNPDYEKVRREIEADPRWAEWVRKCEEQGVR